MSIKEKLLAAAKAVGVRREAVTVFGETLYVHGMAAKEKDEWEKTLSVVRNGKSQMVGNIRASLVTRVLRDESGNLVFAASDVDEIGNWPAAEVSVIFDAAQRLNSVSNEDIEELAKN